MGARPKVVAPPVFAQRPQRYKEENAQPVIQFADDNESQGARQMLRPKGKVS